jgi:DNA-binding CsgD family transcriptional regulator
MIRDDEVGLKELLIQAKITNRLLVAQLKEKMNTTNLAALLASTGATKREIADVLNTTTETVKSALKRLRKKGAKNGSDNDRELTAHLN